MCCICATICILTCWAAVCLAGFSLPPEVYRIGSLKEVQDKARSANAAIVFIYSNENSACGLIKSATLDVVQELKGAAFIIYVSKNDSASIPGNVIKAMNSPAAGKFIPKSVVVNSRTSRIEMIIPYISDRNRRIEEIRKVKGRTAVAYWRSCLLLRYLWMAHSPIPMTDTITMAWISYFRMFLIKPCSA